MSRRVVPDDEPIWRALADPTRRAILDMLAGGPRPTGAVAAAFPTSRFTVMEHLRLLADVGLLTTEKRGRERLHHLNPVPLQQVHERWVRSEAASAATVLLRLADHTESLMPNPTSPPAPTTAGIDVRAEHDVSRDTSTTWSALLDLPAWWPPCWPEDQRLFFEPRLAGRLGTTSRSRADENGQLWGLVSELTPGSVLALDGSMGLPGPVIGQWRMTLEPAGPSRTRVVVVHRVVGEVSAHDRDGFTHGWTRTLTALDRHVAATS